MRVADWLLAGILISWGLGCLSVPDTTWMQPAYIGLRRIAGQETWGSFCVALGVLRMGALFINGAVRRTPHTRMAGAFVSALLWLQLSFAMFNTSIPAIAVAIYPWLFLGDVYNVYRAAQDARLSDNRAKANKIRGKTVDASTSSC